MGIKQMRVREIKQQLDDAGISTVDCFEKEELVQRLNNYKINRKTNDDDDDDNDDRNQEKKKKKNDSNTIRVPMTFHSLTNNKSVASSSNSNLYLRPSPGKFPSITVILPTKGNRKLNLLVDTACSGLILRPNVANELQLPIINAGVTMTAAGGTMNGMNNVCRLDRMQLMDDKQTSVNDFMVVSQD